MYQGSDTNFRWTWWVQVASAVLTFCAVLVALFGEWFRKKLAPPRLELELPKELGTKTAVIVTAPNGEAREALGQFYHVQVSNRKRWSPATGTQIYIVQISEPDAAQRDSPLLPFPIPLRWMGWDAEEPGAKTIGATRVADLCSVVQAGEPGIGKWVDLHPVALPNQIQWRRREPFRMNLTLQARSIEGESPPLRVQIAWDGKWSDDQLEMKRHLVVAKLG